LRVTLRSLVASLLVSAFVVLVLIGCGSKSASQPAGHTDSTVPANVIDSSTAGSITGIVSLDGLPPAPKIISMASEPACAKTNATVVVPDIITGKNGALENVVVSVKSGLGVYRFETPKQPVVLDQKGCMYEPRVVAVMTNQPLEIRNDDPTIHNVHATPKENHEWNKGQPVGGAALHSSFSRPELAIRFMCNVHPWMRAFVFVFDHPYYAITGSEGTFELKNLPPGTYKIEAWQEEYGTLDQTVSLGARESKSVSFIFKPGHPGGD
jgi:hypothetical protein